MADQNEILEEVILVDRNDNPIGFEAKLKAHQSGGKLHRAFSIFIFNSEGKMLLQLRSLKKHHFRELWTNTCCSHPKKGEGIKDSAHRRLKVEFGFDAPLKETFSFIYRASDAKSGLTEYEFDHIFVGEFNGEPGPNPDEINDWRWVDPKEVTAELNGDPDRYTPWFKIAIGKMIEYSASASPPRPAHAGVRLLSL